MKTKLLGFLAFIIIRILSSTFRYKLEFENESEKELFFTKLNSKKPNTSQNFLLGFFHQDEMALMPYFKNTGFCVLVSMSKDGEIMTNLAKHMGYLPVRGSSSRGAVSGLIKSIKKVKEGYNLSFAVDGPRGPIYKVKEGLSAVSKKSDRKIIPCRASVNRAYIFEKAWNKAKLPKPFSRITLRMGKLDYYTPLELENTLIKLSSD